MADAISRNNLTLWVIMIVDLLVTGWGISQCFFGSGCNAVRSVSLPPGPPLAPPVGIATGQDVTLRPVSRPARSDLESGSERCKAPSIACDTTTGDGCVFIEDMSPRCHYAVSGGVVYGTETETRPIEVDAKGRVLCAPGSSILDFEERSAVYWQGFRDGLKDAYERESERCWESVEHVLSDEDVCFVLNGETVPLSDLLDWTTP